uniref:Uncharacterized protein n=1 Tax=Avena sativa TaxID=4498 RepID=A0ACD5XWE8_AVESA
MESAPDAAVGKNPDVWELFRHYDKLYFRGALDSAAFELEWTSPRLKTSSGFGSCYFGKMSKTITLYQPMLRCRTKADLKNALLHLMIHAIIFVKHGMTCLSFHGPVFRDWMDAINDCSIEDYLRPKGGYHITTTHDFSPEELQSIQGNLWKCKSCAATLLRATKLGPPSDSCCIENVRQHATCGNMLCNWHNHKMKCGGTYVVPGRRGQKMVPKGSAVGCKRGLLTETSETSKSEDTVQESDSDEVQENSTVAKGKLLSQVGGRNTKSPGSSSSWKASKSNMPEDFQKAIVPATPRRKLKLRQEFVALEKRELFSIGGCNNAKSLGSCSSKKVDDFQKTIVLSDPPLSKLKRKQTSIASEKHELRPVESFYSANSSRSDTSRKASRWRNPEHVQKSNVQPAASQRKLKVEEDLTLSERYGVFSLGNYNNAKPPRSSTSRKASMWHKPEGVEKSSVAPTPPPKKLKIEEDLPSSERYGVFSLGSCNNGKPPRSSTSRKERTWHKPEGVEKSSVALMPPPKKLNTEEDLTSPERHGVFSLGSCNNAKPPGSSTSRKASTWRQPEGVEKCSVAPTPPPKKLKVEQDLVGKHGDTKPLGGSSSTGNKEGKLHKPEDTQKATVLPAAPPRKLKQDLVASQKNELSSFAGKSNATVPDNISSEKAHSQQHEEESQKPVARTAAPQSIIPKQQNKTNSSTKEEKRHNNPEDLRRTVLQPAVSESKLRRQSNPVAPEMPKTRSVAPEKRRTRSVAPGKKKTRSGKKKEYACISVWANIYESECSSGSAEPLVNKRTERRRRERERLVQITYLRSRKRSASGTSSKPAEEEVSSQQAMPPPQSQCLDFILIDAIATDKAVTRDPRDQSKAPATRMGTVVVPPVDKVMTQAPRGQSQPPAQRMDIVQPLADLVMARARGDQPAPSTCMDIAAVPPADVLTQAPPVHRLQTPAPCSISTGQVVPPPSNASSNPDVIDISDDD